VRDEGLRPDLERHVGALVGQEEAAEVLPNVVGWRHYHCGRRRHGFFPNDGNVRGDGDVAPYGETVISQVL
jgi:hypothetical protein